MSLSTQLGPHEGNVTVRDHTFHCIQVFSSRCLACQSIITEGPFLALGAPYHGVLHVGPCATNYTYPNTWPHTSPAAHYLPARPSR